MSLSNQLICPVAFRACSSHDGLQAASSSSSLLVLFAPGGAQQPLSFEAEEERLPPLMDAKKGKTRKESTPIKVWVTPEEKAAIAAKADAHSLSASSYLRRLGLALPVESTIDQRAILDLVKINADLGRFGGLIKMWLTTNADFQSLSAQGLQRKLENTLSDVRALQKKMSDRFDDL